ncbi:MAG: septum formation initiator family protein [Terriglobus sp.]
METPSKAIKLRGFAAHVGRAGDAFYGNRRRLATGAAALLAVMVGYHVVFGKNGLTAYQNKRHDLRDLQTQSQQLEQDNARLRSHVERLTNDPDAIEHEAREALHYARPGEVIYSLPADPKSASAAR